MTIRSELRGVEVELKTVDGNIKGIVVDVIFDPNHFSDRTTNKGRFQDMKQILLRDVWDIDKGQHIRGCLNFLSTDIIEFIRVGCQRNDDPKVGVFKRRVLSNKKRFPHHQYYMGSVDMNKVCLGSKVGIENANREASIKTSSWRPSVYVVLDSVEDREFPFAVEDILRQEIVSLALTGSNVGRAGELCWVSVATLDVVYLFDVISLGEEASKQSLKQICSNVMLVKVMHDCRSVFDMLKHQFDIELVNVFDTQVADVVIQHNSVDDAPDIWPRYVKSLSVLLKEHLTLSDDAINLLWVRSRDPGLDEKVWTDRPLSDHFSEILVKDIIYLQELRLVLVDKLMRDVNRGIEICLTAFKDLDEESWEKAQEEKHLLPPDFGLKMSKGFRKRGYGDRNGQIDCGVINNAVTSRLTGIIFTSSGVTWVRRNSILRGTSHVSGSFQMLQRLPTKKLKKYLEHILKQRFYSYAPELGRKENETESVSTDGDSGQVTVQKQMMHPSNAYSSKGYGNGYEEEIPWKPSFESSSLPFMRPVAVHSCIRNKMEEWNQDCVPKNNALSLATGLNVNYSSSSSDSTSQGIILHNSTANIHVNEVLKTATRSIVDYPLSSESDDDDSYIEAVDSSFGSMTKPLSEIAKSTAKDWGYEIVDKKAVDNSLTRKVVVIKGKKSMKLKMNRAGNSIIRNRNYLPPNFTTDKSVTQILVSTKGTYCALESADDNL